MSSLVDVCRGAPLTLLLDYDGTLVPIAPTPAEATPDRDLVSLLAALARRPERQVHIVSGRPRDTIEAWFGELSISLWAEHGFWSRPVGSRQWRAAARVPTKALERTYPILDRYTHLTPGSFVERKTASLAWHYRGASPAIGRVQSRALRELLEDALLGTTLEVLNGKKVIEVRPRGISKADVGRRVLSDRKRSAALVAMGDDETDEDLFAALPDSAVTIAVGPGPTCAKYTVDDHLAARNLLAALID